MTCSNLDLSSNVRVRDARRARIQHSCKHVVQRKQANGSRGGSDINTCTKTLGCKLNSLFKTFEQLLPIELMYAAFDFAKASNSPTLGCNSCCSKAHAVL